MTFTQNSTGSKKRRLVLGAAAAFAVIAGAAGATHALARPHPQGWSMDGGIPVDRIEHRADRMLFEVDATPDQKAKIHAIIEAAVKDIDPIRKSMSGTRAQLRTLLAAPQIDRNAVETLRAQRSAGMDQISKRVTTAMEDAADVLTPDQRQKLATIEANHAAHGHHHR